MTGSAHVDVHVDVLVVGGGNAGFSAAHAARQEGRSVLLLEKAPAAEAGGNTYYTAGAFRFAHGGLEDLSPLLDDDPRLPRTVVPPYGEEEFAADILRVSGGSSDRALLSTVVGRSRETIGWLSGLGLPLRLMYERQAYAHGDGFAFWGGLHAGVTGGGKALAAFHTATAERLGARVASGTAMTGLIRDGAAVRGVEAVGPDGAVRIAAARVVLAAGGFEASPEARARWLGEPWRSAFVRGTPTDTGEVLQLALEAGAAPNGDFTTCHSVAWDPFAPDNESNRALTNRLTRGGYPLGIIVDRRGRRFFDEGEDFRNLTYAKLGAAILAQEGGVAFQLFDATTRPLLRTEEYDMPGISVFVADTLDGLAERAGIDPAGLRATVASFNASVDDSRPFEPAVLDGRRADTDPPKSNWARALSTPPYSAYPVGTGITFTFGGLRVDGRARVLDTAGEPIPGLFAAGEIVGGLFSGNYPGGSGLTAGAVLGRLAGSSGAQHPET